MKYLINYIIHEKNKNIIYKILTLFYKSSRNSL